MYMKKCNQFQHGFILVAIKEEEQKDEVIEVEIKGNIWRVKIKELEGDPVNYLDD